MMLFIVDMGGVLAQSFDIIPEAARQLGVPLKVMRSLASTDMPALLCGAMTADEYWRRFSVASGIRAPEDYWSTLFEPMLDTEVEQILQDLHAHGRVVCGTNTIHSHYEYLLAHEAYRCFDGVYASHIMGVCKPDPAFWGNILDVEQAEPHETFFIDDMEENIGAATDLGIISHRFCGAALLRQALDDVVATAGARA